MAVESALVLVAAGAGTGLALSVAIERLMIPAPKLSRSQWAWGLHVGLWLLAYGTMVLILGRPWFATCGVSAFLLMLVLVNNAKARSLREAFVFQDFEYFTDAIRHPRLYIPFLGWKKFIGSATGFALAVSVGFWLESVPVQRFSLAGQLGGVAIAVGVGLLILYFSARQALPVTFNPNLDVRELGLLASLWRYGEEERVFAQAASPFDFLAGNSSANDLPHLVAVQSESFFDPRALYPGIRTDVLAEFDQLKADALACGKLKVSAWGANTVRTEFAFLSGIDDGELGVHRFNPYRAVAAGWDVSTVATFLKRLGYRTVCIHPYPAGFYRRDRVIPRLGFDEFLDIRAFDGAQRSGPYISDVSVADKIASILAEATEPVFVFTITMENHGPLHLERVESSDIANLYSAPPPSGCEDLTVYLRHLKNADEMIGKLRKALEHCGRPAEMCWYGDHVPIMPSVYDRFGAPNGDVEYVLWSSRKACAHEEKILDAHQLSGEWLRGMKEFVVSAMASSS